MVMSNQQWVLVAAAVGGFTFAGGVQAYYVSRVMKLIFETEEKRISTVEGWSKLTRKEVGGILVSLGVTNGLLGAIVAILIFR
jgi:hypothetical protein